ncbi:transglycosylase SLT domain-containing protein [Ancylobacter dichloromethanicus]|uniref:Transglycosylase SLT domain-containing protein n=1 Tax=Ancylobacter dichloromethanicus TaxID=518825 RepID=A0A9W6N0D0_9HYPH|nr:transglycosylase SLT domain-containing protein [Ancylobacter dichloromethanicus]MBS7556401.1 transglycosylase SLT domain-containing protein [Ancylobacter dichloromethanicus]GLK73659.1 hypothetical protein GCM10017643_37770 [Ancylobacter dichloromethanicus]
MTRRLSAPLLLCFAASVALASDCADGDRMLQNRDSLVSLCPDGFTSKSGGSLPTAMKNQPNNVAMVYAAAQNAGVPTDLALAVSYHESVGFNSCAGSDTGVKGPMQLTKKTGAQYGYNRDINQENILGGMQVLKAAYNACGYDYSCLASRYNGSPRPGEQAGWAKGVAAANQSLKSDPALLASACGTQACAMGPGDFSTSTGLAANAPTAEQANVIVAPSQV